MESTSLACELSLEIEKSQIAVAYDFKISRSFASVVIFPVLQSFFFLTAWTIATFFFSILPWQMWWEKSWFSAKNLLQSSRSVSFFKCFPSLPGVTSYLITRMNDPHDSTIEIQKFHKNCNLLQWFWFSNQEKWVWKTNGLVYIPLFLDRYFLMSNGTYFFPFYEFSIALFHVLILWASLKWWAFNAFQ